MTDYPPPIDFDGFEQGVWDRHNYSRQCTERESALLDRLFKADSNAALAAAVSERDTCFADMADEVAELDGLLEMPSSA